MAASSSQQADSAQGNSQQTSQQAYPDSDATAPEATQPKFGLPSLPGKLSLLPTAYKNDACFQQASDQAVQLPIPLPPYKSHMSAEAS